MICRSYPIEKFDPAHLFWTLYPDGPGFLESAGHNPRTGRFSIVPLRCRESYRIDGAGLHCIGGLATRSWDGDPFMRLGEIFDRHRLEQAVEIPFVGGFFGFLAYDLSWWIEDLPRRADGSDPEDWKEPVLGAVAGNFPAEKFSAAPATSDLKFEQFTTMVERAKTYIAAGDIYQANLSCRFQTRCQGASSTLYRRLRAINPSPFACYLQTPEIEIISSSPERLVSLQRGWAEARPIAGTRKRGTSSEQDQALENELLAHPKERAEHVMLIDLERNDLGKVCRAGSVQVDELMVLERYSHVQRARRARPRARPL